VPGGTYYRTYDEINYVDAGFATAADGGPTGESDPATVSGFRLDKYLVTVGRFRQFVAAWNGGTGYVPAAGAGRHTHLNDGNGLNSTSGGYELGWVATDNGNIAPSDTNLACGSPNTWTSSAGTQESLPINCVLWWEAYAFCIWDGGFLPSEAEWEYAAAGGGDQREYPWGAADPGTSNQYAIYGDGSGTGNCYYPSGGTCAGVANIAPVGVAARGAGLWGQLDLAGEVFEWNLDFYASYVNPSANSANLAPPDPAAADGATDSARVIRGGAFFYTSDLPAAYRNYGSPMYRSNFIGFRCARTP
jgi:sulfatase modifying factor 1